MKGREIMTVMTKAMHNKYKYGFEVTLVIFTVFGECINLKCI